MWRFVAEEVMVLMTCALSHIVDAALLLRPLAKPCFYTRYSLEAAPVDSTTCVEVRPSTYMRYTSMHLRDVCVETSP